MSRAVLAPFEAYQKARVTFVQTVAELAQRPQNIEALQSAGKFTFKSFVDSSASCGSYFAYQTLEHVTEIVFLD